MVDNTPKVGMIEQMILKDFKSFGGTHRLELGQGMTVIVGPNGSGKSNLLDGLRWVLGETNPSRLRINRQSDLIFQGSISKDEGTQASVSLIFADQNRRGELTRSLDSNGGSVVADGEKIRLSDLPEFKSRWGLSGDRFAFIGQGEVTNQIAMRPTARRMALEELFGVDLYRAKRDAATEKLEGASNELARLATLTAELDHRQKEIAPQIEKAQRYEDLEEQISSLTGRLYHLRRLEDEEAIAQLGAQIEALTVGQTLARQWLDRWQKLNDRYQLSGENWFAQRQELKEHLEQLGAQRENWVAKLSALDVEIQKDRQQTLTLQSQCDELERRLQERQEKCDLQAGLVAQLSQELESLTSANRQLEEQVALQAESSRQNAEQREQLVNLRGQKVEQLELCRSRLWAMDNEKTEDLGPLEEARDQLMDQLAKVETEQDQAEDQLDQLLERYEQDQRQRDDLLMRLRSLRGDLQRRQHELDEAQIQGHPAPVEKLLAASRLKKLTFPLEAVADLFDCPQKYTVALEAFLGGRASWLVCETVNQAGQAIDLLKASSGGRATLLPLEKCRRHQRTAVTEQGVLGWGVDLVKPKKNWEPAVEHLLGGVLVVNDFMVAKKVATNARFTVVTLDGEVFQPGGAISGGSSKRMGPLAAKRHRETLFSAQQADEQSVEKLQSRVDQLNQTLEQTQAQVEQQRQRCDHSRLFCESLRRQLRDRQSKLDEALRLDQQRQDRRQKLEAEANELEGQLQTIADQLLNLTGQESSNLKELVDETRHKMALVSEKLESERRRLAEFSSACMELKNDMFVHRNDLGRLEADLQHNTQCVEQGQQAKDQLDQQYKEAEERLMAVEQQMNRRSGTAQRLIRHLESAKFRGEQIQSDHQRRALEKQKLEARLLESVQAYEDRYPFDQRITETESAERLGRMLAKAERAQRELGQVNRGVLDENRSLQQRLDFLRDQTADAQKASDELQSVIAQADRQAAELFSQSLKKMDQRFNGLFVRLFGGGEARLIWDQSAGGLEGGVEITARPPGKRALYLAQLSGGEQSLTALALLFAAMETADVPLAVLDEVDAALDEVNLGRFADLATEYAKGVQLLCMTHRRQTMERADRAFGVTMSEPGLSQVVGLKVDQWI